MVSKKTYYFCIIYLKKKNGCRAPVTGLPVKTHIRLYDL